MRRFRQPLSGGGDESGTGVSSSSSINSSGERVFIVRGSGGARNIKSVDNAAIDQLMLDLEGWREVIILTDGILGWERPRLLAGVFVGVSLLFVLVWFLEPSVLTTVSLLLLFLTLLDYAVPVIAPRLFTFRTSWTSLEEQRYREICRRLVNAKRHLKDAIVWLFELRRDRPTFYFALVVPCLFVLSVVGDRVNNMFLTYAILTFLLFLPGLRHHGFLTQARREVTRFIGTNLGISGRQPIKRQ